MGTNNSPRGRGAISRRSLLAASGAAGLWAFRALPSLGQNVLTLLPRTPACHGGVGTTPSATEGPHFRPNSPERTDIAEGRYPGHDLLVGGHILDRACRPISGALTEIWQAGPDGEYGLNGFHLHGHHYTSEDGRWLLTTVEPAPYWPRARHIHLKVQRPGGAAQTTQMFLLGDPTQASDSQFDQRLVAPLFEGATKEARMDFVLS